MVSYHASFRETTIKQDHLPELEVFELGPKFFQDPRVTSHAAHKPANPTVLTELVNQQQQLVDLVLILRLEQHVVDGATG